MEPGTKVHAHYRNNDGGILHTGVVLPKNSVEAWKNTMRFHGETPTQEMVDDHVAWIEKNVTPEYETVWVEWSFGKIYSERVKNLEVLES